MSNHRPALSEFENRLERYYAAAPRPGFEHELEQQLLESAYLMSSSTNNSRSTLDTLAVGMGKRILQLGLSLAGLALVVMIIILALQVRPQPGAVVAPQSTTTPTPTPTPFSTTAPVPFATAPSAAPEPRLLPGLCPAASPTPNPPTAPQLPRQPQAVLGGGEVTVGDFTFDLRLACDPRFQSAAPDLALISDIENLGVAYHWRYHGPTLEGETVTYAGIQPYVTAGGMSGPSLSDGSSGDELTGLHWPGEIFVTLPPGDIVFSYLVKLYTPAETWVGAELRFTLRPEAGGYRPVQISAIPLSAAQLSDAPADGAQRTPASPGYTLLPTLAPQDVDTVLGRLHALEAPWESQLLDEPGWLLLRWRREYLPSGEQTPHDAVIPVSIEESWYELDEKGFVQRSINRQLNEQGQLIEGAVMQNGQYRNLTTGDSGSSGPAWQPHLDFGFYSVAALAIRQGLSISQTEVISGAQTLAVFTIDHSGYRTSLTLDTDNGRILVYQNWRSPGPGLPLALETQIALWQAERVSAPPPEILALLDTPSTPYQPATPQGELAPAGFDPSASYLGMNILAADATSQPSAWVGDLYALPQNPGGGGLITPAQAKQNGGYLLGRVDFGAVPGGWCDRSANGKRLAFNWQHPSQETGPDVRLRWFELSAPGMVYEPDPALVLSSPVSFAPSGYTLAFFACKNGACGLYLLEADQPETPARLLTPDLNGYAPPTWKPDGSQLASESLDAQGAAILTIVDIQTGAILYQGPRLGSPFENWGAALTIELTGFGRCISP